MHPLHGLDAAILRTVIYADVFDFPLTPRELVHFLIGDEPVDPAMVERALSAPTLMASLAQHGGYVMLRGREHLAELRAGRRAAADTLWTHATSYGAWLSRLPFVRLVAVTGALAMHNPASASDDIDYLLVAAPGRVWLARMMAIGVVVVARRLSGITLCPNYVLSEAALVQDRRDLYIAHEVAQMVPLHGGEVYRRLRASNPWVHAHLPNAHGPFVAVPEVQLKGFWGWAKQFGEWVLAGPLGAALEEWEFRRKQARFAKKVQAASAARIDSDHVKGHFNDHGVRVLARYQMALENMGLATSDASLSAAAD